MNCRLCPCNCGIDRSKTSGRCHSGLLPNVAKIMLHHWEEPCISGNNGSGAVFFSGCNMHCIFCQNHDLNDGTAGIPYDSDMLSEVFLSLQEKGAHNINLVTPSPHIETIIPAIEKSRLQGLTIPIVYNTSSYEKVDTLKRLEGLIDVYMPDYKYRSSKLSGMFSGCQDYAEYAEPAIIEMFRQVGLLHLNKDGLAEKGIVIRHLVLPGCIFDTRDVLDHIHDTFPADIHISLMGQYTPNDQVSGLSFLNRRITRREYDNAIEYALTLGFKNLMIQELCSAESSFTPDFSFNEFTIS